VWVGLAVGVSACAIDWPISQQPLAENATAKALTFHELMMIVLVSVSWCARKGAIGPSREGSREETR